MKAILFYLLGLFSSGVLIAQSVPCFTYPSYLYSGNEPKSLAVADFNSDGKMDIASGNFSGSNVSVAFGNGNGTFGTPALYNVGTGANGLPVLAFPIVTKGDFNNDGKMDLATGNHYYYCKQLSILLNNGNGTFATSVEYSVGLTPTIPGGPDDIESGDFNHDGNTDIAIVSGPVGLSVFLGNGSGTFPTFTNIALPAIANSLLCGKFNNDAYDDLVIVFSASISVLFGSSSGTFSSPTYYPYGAYNYITAADFNNDGFNDIAAGNGVLLGSSTGSFTAISTNTYVVYGGIAPADYDGDGFLDLAIINSTSMDILCGLGTGYFNPPVTFTFVQLGTQAAETVSADFDGDLKPDVCSGSFIGGTDIRIMLNRSFSISASASSTAICSGLNSTLSISGGATSYSWTSLGVSNTVVVTPTANTVYSVTATNTLGCSYTRTLAVAVYPVPTLAISGPTSICRGTSATISVNGANSYTWNSGSNSASISVSPTLTTTYSVTGASTANCMVTQSKNVAVYVQTLTISGPNSICIGNNATISVNGSNSYTWNSGSNSASISVSPTLTTTYSVTGTSTANCIGTQSINVIVYPVPTLTIFGPVGICIGNSVTMSVNGASSYTWNSGPHSANISVSPILTTSYSVSGTSIGNCIGTQSINVVVYPVPTLAISAPTSICIGNTTTINVNGANSYTWNSGYNSASISVSPTLTTTYSVAGTNTNNCIGTQSIDITVYPIPILTISGSSSICAGNNATMIVNGANSYTWNSGSNLATISVSPTLTTTYSVAGTNTANCIGTQSINMIVLPLPSLSLSTSNPSLCAGETATLLSGGAATYTWNTGAHNASVAITPTLTTTYSVAGTSTANCIGTQSVNIIVLPLPSLTLSTSNPSLCAGETATLLSGGASTYTWNTGVQNASVFVTPTVTTSFTVTGTDGNGCENSSFISQNVFACTGFLSSFKTINNIVVSPNTFESEFEITYNTSDVNVAIDIFNNIGELVFHTTKEGTHSTVNLEEKAKGLYFVKISGNNREIAHFKIIKQ